MHEVGQRRDHPCRDREQHQYDDRAGSLRPEPLGAVAEPPDEEREAEDEEEAEFQRALRGDLEIEYDANGCPVTVRIAWTSG